MVVYLELLTGFDVKDGYLMGVLYAVRYARSALGSLCAQSFPFCQIIFFKMVLTSLLLTSTFPFAWGWYDVVMR